MADLDKLMQINGVIAAGEFTDNDELVAYKGEVTEEQAKKFAEVCAMNNSIAKRQVEEFSALSGFNWSPLHGWAIAGPEYSLCVMGNVGVIVKNELVSFNDIFKALAEESHK
ncbi:DUF2173 family protein [Hydrogenobacter thermophilus]|uniref:DUF2173 family protein n=1 Tax=Hydrogenobacter thermophilus TaxID=940 RepID=UPI0030F643E2